MKLKCPLLLKPLATIVQENSQSFYPSEPFRISHFTMRHPVIEATIPYYPIRNGWKLRYGNNGLFYYKTIQDCRSHDLKNLGLKIHNFSLELKQSKTPPAASCWIISTLVRRYVFFNPRLCKSWDCPNIVSKISSKIETLLSARSTSY